MTVVKPHDITISIDIPQPDGKTEKIYLQELNNIQTVQELANISRRVAISDTADLIFRLFAKSQNGDADINKLSGRIPCLGKKYIQNLQEFFAQPNNTKIIQEYNASNDKKHKRELRKKITNTLSDYVSKNISTQDMQYNFSKFKYKYDSEFLSIKDQLSHATNRIFAKTMGLKTKDPFVMATLDIWKDCLEKRSQKNREAYWMLVYDSNHKLIGMTFISSKVLKDKFINANIIGHSGQILDPSAQGHGYVSAIKSVMIDFMYDNMDDKIASDSFFATTCDEFNENSQGLQRKSGAKLLQDKNGNIIIDKGKMHWYATQDEIMNSELMKRATEQGIKYTVTHTSNHNSYTKNLNNPKHVIIPNTKDYNYERIY